MIIQADARHIPLADGSVQCVISSPPYWGLRDYGTARWDGGDAGHEHDRVAARNGRGGSGSPGKQTIDAYPSDFPAEKCACGARRIDAQIGLEPTPEAYVATMVQVFREVKRVLRDDGTLWLNLGDSYAANWNSRRPEGGGGFKKPKCGDISAQNAIERVNGAINADGFSAGSISADTNRERIKHAPPGLKAKDLIGIPWRVALALQADGWYLRSDIIWAKPNPMPESVTDRPTRSHEYLFLLSKSERYYFDQDAIREPNLESSIARMNQPWNGETVRGHPSGNAQMVSGGRAGGNAPMAQVHPLGRNKRDVWTVNSEPTPEAHFATFPQKLIEPCILAGTSEKGCCAECGAPRVRMTEAKSVSRHELPRDNPNYRPARYTRKTGSDEYANGGGQRFHVVTGEDWYPMCECQAPSVPCVVFDPFIGSGTVGKVCERLGRRWAGLELSADYIGIARKRTAQRGLWL